MSDDQREKVMRQYNEAAASDDPDALSKFLDSQVDPGVVAPTGDTDGSDAGSNAADGTIAADKGDDTTGDEIVDPDGSDDAVAGEDDDVTSGSEDGEGDGETVPPDAKTQTKEQKRYNDAQRKISEQGAELAELRKQQQAMAPIIQALSDPNAAARIFAPQQPVPGQQALPQQQPIQPQGEPFDFTDPNSVALMAQRSSIQAVQQVFSGLAQKAQQDKQRQMAESFQSSVNTGRKKLMGGKEPMAIETINQAEARFQQMLMNDYPGTAVMAVNLEAKLKEQFRKGRESAFTEMRNPKGGATRATGRTNRGHGKPSVDVKSMAIPDMDLAQLSETLATEPRGSARYNAAAQLAYERAKQEKAPG